MQVKHGTNQGWLQGCRKQCCKKAHDCHTQKIRRFRKDRGTYVDPYVDPFQAVEHMKYLRDQHGVSARKISMATGIKEDILSRWMTGRVERVSRENAEKVLAVDPKNAHRVEGGYHPVEGASRRLRAMYLRGFSDSWVSRHTGMSPKSVWDVREANSPVVRDETLEKIKKVFNDTLLISTPDDQYAKRIRLLALKKGYHPFGVWEDIDDPNCVPEVDDPEYSDAPLQDGVERCRSLTARGFTIGEIADTCGLPRPNLHKIVHGKKKQVLPETTKKIHAGCDKLDVLPDSTGPYADRARRIAKRNGWG